MATKPKTRIWLSDSPSGADLEKVAAELGIDLSELRQMMRFRDSVRQIAMRLDLAPPIVVGGVMNILSEVILQCYDPKFRHELIADLIAQMTDWAQDEDDKAPEIIH